MKRIILCLFVLILCITVLPDLASADNNTLILPENVQTISDQAFIDVSGFGTLFIPKSVGLIGSLAFANCESLREVYVGRSESMSIARDAFQGCTDLHFYVYPGTKGEVYAMSHGYTMDYLDAGSSFLERAMQMVAENGGSTVLQSGEFASQRLIVKRSNHKLPDISEYDPKEVIYDEDVFIIQFSSVDDTSDCYTLLVNDPQTVFVEADESVCAIDEVSAQGYVDPGIWGTGDPMGFDAYSQFVAENGGGSVTIAVVDSGVQRLASYSARLRNDGINMLKAQDDQDWSADFNRHGSVIASVINDCAGSNQGVSILPVRVVGASGNTDFILLGNGIKYAVSHGANIINLSLNFKESAYVTHCINEAVNAGVTVVVAAGNSSRNISNVYPANLDNVITVSGLAGNWQLSATSNFGAGVNYCAPDSYVKTSAYSNSLYNGTSFSVPMIATALALVRMDPYHTIDDMNATCYLSDDPDNPPSSFGNGMPRLAGMANVAVTSVSFDSSMPAELAVGDVIPLSWTILPENATDKTVSVASIDPGILRAETSDTGTMTLRAIAPGTGTIKLLSNGSGVSVERTFTVVQPVRSITLQGAEERLPLQRKLRLTAVVSPENATTKEIEWVSTNEDVATVTQDGLVEPVSVGTVGIYARAKDGYGAQSAVVSINVIDQPDAEYIVLKVNGVDVTNGTYNMQPGDAVQLNAAVFPEEADQTVTYIAGGSYFTVSDTGVITAVSKGSGATVIVMSKDGAQRAALGINVIVPPASVSISGESVVNEGNTITLTANVLPENADDRTVTWSIIPSNIADVSTSGVVTGLQAGTAVITATANGDSSISASKQIEVRHPYTISFDLNAGGDASAAASFTSMSAFSGYAVGELASASRDYYTFDGWYSQANGGVKYTSASVLNTTENSVTFYAHWTAKPWSDWVLTSQVPANARVVDTSYSYRESTESTSSSLSGWTPTGNYWKQNGSGGSKNWSSQFPAGFDQSHWIYTSFAKSQPYTAYENNSSKRDVTNNWAGYVYWHWMYDTSYSNGNTIRQVYTFGRKEPEFWSNPVWGPVSGNGYKYFGAFTSTTNYSLAKDWSGYCEGTNTPNYDVSDRISWDECQGNRRWFRFDYYLCTYKDYDKYYKYYRDISYQATDPGNGSNISNKTTYVKYQLK